MDNVLNGAHGCLAEEQYVPPADPVTLQRLEWFKDQKLALMMHWGAYSQLGIVESWAMSDQDSDWSRDGVDWDVDSQAFKRQYVDLNKSFNPVRFEPDKWADAAKDGGFKYLIFTTKHHDGFCMWDTKFTDYKITNRDCPFSVSKRADVVSNVFEAFRRRKLGIAAYFSKADWNVPYYWAKGQFKGEFTSRGPSYVPEEKPELWEKFVRFTHDQVMELVTDYGRIDILWFDGGWVRRDNGQDIRIEELMEKARRVQPWLLSADRTVGGVCENYITPEQSVPAAPIFVPWESCVSMGRGFAYSYDDDYKPAKQLLRLLIDICAKGGNLALNVAPQPDGRLPGPALTRMAEMGAWLKQYGDAVYGTRVCPPYTANGFAFTQKAEENKVFAFWLNDDPAVTGAVIPYTDKKVKSVVNMTTGETLPFETVEGGVAVNIGRPAPCEAYGGEAVAEVFALSV
ncbi:MAG: alpha-L-fucosidase [Clostridiales bacterium]|jgi:alpha-L-fucosidase|nr:alpha-L-fucosidase [Clostridiales bacterium]